MTSVREVRYGFHFLKDDRRTGSGDLGVVEVGKLYKVKPPIVVCKNGLHGSSDPLISLQHAPGAVATWCEFRGPFSDDSDGKFAAAERKVLALADVTRELHEFAVWTAGRALMRERKAGREPDERSWNALRVKTRWLDGKATDAEMEAAWGAALGAAWGATLGAAQEAAWGAARGAAQEAAWGAAWGAARGAAWGAAQEAAWGAARGAAWGAARGAALGAEQTIQRKRLTASLNRALGIGATS